MRLFQIISTMILSIILLGEMTVYGQQENTSDLGFIATQNDGSTFLSNQISLGITIPINCYYKLEYNNRYISSGQFYNGRNPISFSIPGFSSKSGVYSFILHLKYGSIIQKWYFSCHVSIKSTTEKSHPRDFERKSRFKLSLLINQQLLSRRGKQVTYQIPSNEVEDIFSKTIYRLNSADGSFQVPRGFSPFSVLAWFLQQKKPKKNNTFEKNEIVQRIEFTLPVNMTTSIKEPRRIILQLIIEKKE